MLRIYTNVRLFNVAKLLSCSLPPREMASDELRTTSTLILE